MVANIEEFRSAKQPLPSDASLEGLLIGAVLSTGKADAALKHLEVKSFYDPRHSVIWQSITALSNQNAPVDLTTVETWLKEQNLFPKAGGLKYLAKVYETAIVGFAIEKTAERLRDYWLRRQLIESANIISELGRDTSRDTAEVLKTAESKIFEVSQRLNRGVGFVRPSEIVYELWDEIDNRASGSKPLGLSSGFRQLDEMTGGYKNGTLNYVLARPKTGKTVFGLQSACHVAIAEQKNVLYFSLEMSAKELLVRQLAAMSSVDSRAIERGVADDRAVERFISTINDVGTKYALDRLHIEETPVLTMDEIASKCRSFIAENGSLGAVFIDHIHLVSFGRNCSAYEGVSEVSTKARVLAKELNIPIIALCQPRDVSDRATDKRLTEYDFRDTKTAVQDAYLFICLHRQKIDDPNADDTIEIDVKKARGSETGMFTLRFEGKYQRLVDPTANVVPIKKR